MARRDPQRQIPSYQSAFQNPCREKARHEEEDHPRNLYGGKGRRGKHVFCDFLGREEIQIPAAGIDSRIAGWEETLLATEDTGPQRTASSGNLVVREFRGSYLLHIRFCEFAHSIQRSLELGGVTLEIFVGRIFRHVNQFAETQQGP